jgi:hypothetical protein
MNWTERWISPAVAITTARVPVEALGADDAPYAQSTIRGFYLFACFPSVANQAAPGTWHSWWLSALCHFQRALLSIFSSSIAFLGELKDGCLAAGGWKDVYDDAFTLLMNVPAWKRFGVRRLCPGSCVQRSCLLSTGNELGCKSLIMPPVPHQYGGIVQGVE